MRLKIVNVGEQVLRQPARPLTVAEIRSSEIQQLIQHMRETMNDAPGVGLAAPQVGFPLQLVVIEDKQEYFAGLTPEQIAERERQPLPFHVILNPVLHQAIRRQSGVLRGMPQRARLHRDCAALAPGARGVPGRDGRAARH